MPKPSFDRADVRLSANLTEAAPRPRPDPDIPMRIALLGDFSGRRNRSITPSTSRTSDCTPLRVDRDNFDQVFARLGVALQLPLADNAAPLTVRFSELDDFHPDRLFQRLELFQGLRDLRRDLRNPSTFAAAAARMSDWAKPATAPPAPVVASPPMQKETDELMEMLLAQTSEAPKPAERSSGGDLHALLRSVVAPHLLRNNDQAKQAELEAAVDQAATRQMRALLHHPDFQAVEAAWRAAEFLVRRLDTDADLQLYLVDVSKEELAADLAASDDRHISEAYRIFVEQAIETPGGQPWAVLTGLYRFDASREDVEMLARLGAIAQRAGAPFLAEADSRLLGCSSLAESPDPKEWRPSAETDSNWEALRGYAAAASLGLALPRFLLRLPYGKGDSSTETFAFEEMAEKPAHEDYLWGSPAVAWTFLLAEAFSRSGWNLEASLAHDIEDLPAHVYRESGESRFKPCAEVLLTQRAAEAIQGKGLTPLLSVRNRDVIHVGRLQSVAAPSAPLAGRWR